MGWYAHDFFVRIPRGDGLGCRGEGGGGNVRQVKTRIPGEGTYPEVIIGFHH